MPRFRRDSPDEPQGSIVLQGSQPLNGPDRHPTLDLNYNQRLINNGRTSLDAFGGANLHRGHVSPQAGLAFEHNINKDFFVNGRGHVQPGPHGRISPSVNAGLGWRFRRDAPEPQGETPQAQSESKGSIVVQGRQPLSGPDRNPTLDINYNQRVIDDGKTTVDAFGGANIYRGRITPQAGVESEHNFNKDFFATGRGQVQPGPRGGISPSVHAGLGWRFRCEVLPFEEEQEKEDALEFAY